MRNSIAILLIFLGSVLIALPLIKPGLHQIHDDQQIARLYLLDQSTKSGQFPVRWVDGLGFGFGYPLFVFYPPLVYYVGEIYHLVGFGFVDSIKLVFFTSVFASGLFIYIFIKELWGKIPALTASIFYMFLPYRALDMFVRGALAESFSFVWLPIILWAYYKLFKNPTLKNSTLAGLFLALLMITHNLVFLPFIMTLAIYLLFLFVLSEDKKRFTVNCLLSTVFAFGLSAFFSLPSLMEKKFTIVDDLLLINLANYNLHFVYPRQLWNWPWGFGGSTAGLADGISFKIGKLHVILSVAALVFALASAIKVKSKFILHTSYFILLFFGLFIASAFMTTFYSKFIWDLIPQLGYLQFPWRFLTFTGLFASILTGYFIYALKVPIIKLTIAAMVIFLVIFTNLKLFKPQAYRFDLTDQKATSKEYINWYVSSSSFEYLPKGVPLYMNNLGANSVKIDQQQIPKEPVSTNDPETKINILKNSPSNLIFNVNAQNSTQITVNRFNFPGWKAKVNDYPITINDNNVFKLITLNIPSNANGNSKVEVSFQNTTIVKISNMISLISIVIVLLIIIKNARKRRQTSY